MVHSSKHVVLSQDHITFKWKPVDQTVFYNLLDIIQLIMAPITAYITNVCAWHCDVPRLKNWIRFRIRRQYTKVLQGIDKRQMRAAKQRDKLARLTICIASQWCIERNSFYHTTALRIQLSKAGIELSKACSDRRRSGGFQKEGASLKIAPLVKNFRVHIGRQLFDWKPRRNFLMSPKLLSFL
jgi:hypothetical protein